MNSSRRASINSSLRIAPAALAISVLGFGAVVGCGDSGTSGSSASKAMEARISGNINDQHGPIMNSRLEVTDKSGSVVVKTELVNSNSYNIVVPASASYPIVFTAYPQGASAANSTPVKAVVNSPLADRMDVTDVSTIVVESAMQLGGLTAENIAKASGAAIGLRQREGVSAGAGGGGGGVGQSGGGVSRGGHGGHGEAAGSAAPAAPATGTTGTTEHGSGHVSP
jgi:hypothetical protein